MIITVHDVKNSSSGRKQQWSRTIFTCLCPHLMLI